MLAADRRTDFDIGSLVDAMLRSQALDLTVLQPSELVHSRKPFRFQLFDLGRAAFTLPAIPMSGSMFAIWPMNDYHLSSFKLHANSSSTMNIDGPKSFN